MILHTWQLLVAAVAGWVNKEQRVMIAYIKDAGVDPVRLPRRSPNLNAFAERFVLSIKSECLSKMLFFSEAALRRAIREYVEHYHTERNHQGLDNRLIRPPAKELPAHGPVECKKRLGGLLKFYCRRAS
jgi:putative transposase